MIFMPNRSGNRIRIVFVVILIRILEVIVYKTVVVKKKLAVTTSACDVGVQCVFIGEGVGGLLLVGGRWVAGLGLG